jgi:hypothetical protein
MTGREPRPQRRPETGPPKSPHLHVRTVDGLLGEAIAITGSAKALLQLRAQIDRALQNETSHPFEEDVYQDIGGIEFEVTVKRAKSWEEMEEPVPRPERTAERLPRSEIVGEDAAEKKRRADGEDS